MLFIKLTDNLTIFVYSQVKEQHYKNNPEWKWSSKDRKSNKNLKHKNEEGDYLICKYSMFLFSLARQLILIINLKKDVFIVVQYIILYSNISIFIVGFHWIFQYYFLYLNYFLQTFGFDFLYYYIFIFRV